MKKLHTAVSAVLLCAMLIMLLVPMTGCGSSLNGTWTSTSSEKGTSLTFRSSGAVTIKQGEFKLNGTFTAEEETGALTINVTDEAEEMYQFTMTYYIDGKKLYLKNSDGKTEIFTK